MRFLTTQAGVPMSVGTDLPGVVLDPGGSCPLRDLTPAEAKALGRYLIEAAELAEKAGPVVAEPLANLAAMKEGARRAGVDL